MPLILCELLACQNVKCRYIGVMGLGLCSPICVVVDFSAVARDFGEVRCACWGPYYNVRMILSLAFRASMSSKRLLSSAVDKKQPGSGDRRTSMYLHNEALGSHPEPCHLRALGPEA